jgi:nicotinamide-nucleotide amidase
MSTSNLDAASVVKKLKKKGLTLSCAESITGGGLASAITDVAGSSAVFEGAIVSYSDKSKTSLLAVLKRLITKHTAVSEEVAIAMAEGARAQFKTDFAISTTGVAGPGKAYGQKAGTVWIAIASKKSTQTISLQLSGDRAAIRHATIASALATFERILST